MKPLLNFIKIYQLVQNLKRGTDIQEDVIISQHVSFRKESFLITVYHTIIRTFIIIIIIIIIWLYSPSRALSSPYGVS
jgi:hypothetical protein